MKPPRNPHQCAVIDRTYNYRHDYRNSYSAWCHTCGIGCMYGSQETATNGAHQHEQSQGRVWGG